MKPRCSPLRLLLGRWRVLGLALMLTLRLPGGEATPGSAGARRTTVSIVGGEFHANGQPTYAGQPILFNEDGHFDFEKPRNNLVAAVGEGASWGYFDFRMSGEGFDDGYQSVPVNWGLSSPRKRAFFDLLAKITGSGSNSPPTQSGSP